MATNALIIVSGPSGSGKTYIATALSRRIRAPLIAKDDIKESLFDSLGLGDREWSRRLGGASMEMLFRFAEHQLEAGAVALVEGNFKGQASAERIASLAMKYGTEVTQVICTAEESVLDARIRERWSSGRRHPGHVDDLTVAEKASGWSAKEGEGITANARTIRIDTTDLSKIDIDSVCEKIMDMTRHAQSGRLQ